MSKHHQPSRELHRIHDPHDLRRWRPSIPYIMPCTQTLNTQVAVMEKGTGLRILSDDEVDAVVKEVEEEKAAAEAAKRGGAGAAGGAAGGSS